MGTAVVAALVLVALLAPWIAPYAPRAISGPSLANPSRAHLLGTNDAGSDILSRVLWGARETLLVVAAATSLVLAIGVAVGLYAGVLGGMTDVALMRVVPKFPLLILIAALAGPSRTVAILTIGLTLWPETARLVRSQTLTLRTRGFFASARGFGAGPLYVIRRHLLPTLGPIIASNLVYMAGTVVVVEAGLSFIGLGDPTAVSWGAELNRAFANPQLMVGSVWIWWLLPPAIALTLAILGFTFIGVGLEPLFNPRAERR
jgi:peptide/nickel transport system permease protein